MLLLMLIIAIIIIMYVIFVLYLNITKINWNCHLLLNLILQTFYVNVKWKSKSKNISLHTINKGQVLMMDL